MLSAERLVWWSEKLVPLFADDVIAEMQSQPNIVKRVINETDEYWIVHDNEVPVALFGIVNGSLIAQSAYVWFIPFKTYRTKHLLKGRKLFEDWAIGYRSIIAQCFNDRSKRFARLFKFTEIAPGVFERKN